MTSFPEWLLSLSLSNEEHFQGRKHKALFSVLLAGKSPELHTVDPQASTLTPQRMPWPCPLPVATSLLHRGERSCSESSLSYPQGHLLLLWVLLIRPSPALGLAQWSLISQAANLGCRSAGPARDICLPEGEGPAPRGTQSSAGLGLVRRENRVSRAGLVSQHSTSGGGALADTHRSR